MSRIVPDVLLLLSSDMVFDQEVFLANEKDAQQFIDHVSECLWASKITVVRSNGDADTDIAATALHIDEDGKTAVVYNDDTVIIA